MSLRNFGDACWSFSRRTARTNVARGARTRLLGRVLARFAFLAEAANGFAQADSKGGDGFQALLAAMRESAVILTANFREQELGVAQDSG
jgi:hypothetical protein